MISEQFLRQGRGRPYPLGDEATGRALAADPRCDGEGELHPVRRQGAGLAVGCATGYRCPVANSVAARRPRHGVQRCQGNERRDPLRLPGRAAPGFGPTPQRGGRP